jgi:hypothetical protein
MSEASILCPHCRRPVVIEQAVAAGLRKQIEAEARAGLEAQAQSLAVREAEAARREAEVARLKAETQALKQQEEQRIREEVARQAKLAQEQARAEAARAAAGELGLLKQQVDDARKDRDAAQAREIELRKRSEAVEQKEKALELTLARRVDEERVRLQADAQRLADEKYLLDIKQRDEREAGLKRTIDDLKRRSEQGSMQTQGEALETWLEDALRREFVADLVEPVAKGVRGADLVQRVRGAGGAEAGTILWESKRTKAWTADWIAKLKDDQRDMKAQVAALVTQALPAGAAEVSCVDGVWVCTYRAALGMAALIRDGLLAVASERRSQENRGDKEAMIYAYLTGGEFKRRFEGFLEPLLQLEKELDREKAAYQRIWAAREKQIERAKHNLLGLRGDVEGLAGNVLPALDDLERLAPGDD